MASILFLIQDIFVHSFFLYTNKNATGTGHSGPKYPLWPLRAPPATRQQGGARGSDDGGPQLSRRTGAK